MDEKEKARKLRSHIARLTVLEKEISGLIDQDPSWVSDSYHDDFRDIIKRISDLMSDDFSFLSNNLVYYGQNEVQTQSLIIRLRKAVSFVNEAFGKELGLEQVNVTLDNLKDDELKSRCADLLRAHNHFERAVNIATTVLEDRLRQKTDQTIAVSGVELVNTSVKSERSKSLLVLGSNDGEQRGFADIIRGIMAAHRNPTHHTLYSISQLDAARICAYIDVILDVINNGTVNKELTKGN
jgi:uncharacterized protein (TIGR02391 family)